MIWPSGLADLWVRLALPWLVETTCFAGLALIALLLLRGRSAHLRAGIATIALAKALIPPVLLPAGLFPWRLVLLPASSGAESPADAPAWVAWIALLHAVGIVAVAGRCALQLLWLRRLEKRSTPLGGEAARALTEVSSRLGLSRPPSAVVSPAIRAPFVAGLRRATLYLPERWTERTQTERLRPVLAHELVHVRSRDPWFAWLGTLTTVVWWFHPLVHLVQRAAEDAREERCDDVVLAEALAEPSTYAHALLDAAERAVVIRPAPPSFVNASLQPHGGLASRLRRITTSGLRRRHRLTWTEAGLLVGLAAMALPATTRTSPEPRPGETVRWIHLGSEHAGHHHAHGH